MLEMATSLVHLDFSPPHRPPSPVRVAVATLAAILAALAADALVVAIGEAVFPHTVGYAHFQFADYAKLTVIGVIIAGVGWPIVARITSTPNWLYLRLAVLVTLVLFLPDVYILYLGQPTDAVGVLLVMHVAIAAVTYPLLVGLAPVRSPRAPDRVASPAGARR